MERIICPYLRDRKFCTHKSVKYTKTTLTCKYKKKPKKCSKYQAWVDTLIKSEKEVLDVL